MTLSLQPRHLARYRDLVWLLFKYGRSDVVARARLEEVFNDDLPETDTNGSAGPESFAPDLSPDLLRARRGLRPGPDLTRSNSVTPSAVSSALIWRESAG